MDAEAWIDLLLKRGPELRRAGILSIGCDGNSAVLAPADPRDGNEEADKPAPPSDEPSDLWESPGSYPSGQVPTIERDPGELPPIPSFGDD